MTDKEKLYETLGELLYVVAMADGIIQRAELDRLSKLLEHHAFAAEIKWSFDYEVSHHSDVDEIYNKVISYCHSIGPSPEYTEFIGAMRVLAGASGGVSAQENEIINRFSHDLAERFEQDIKKKNLHP